MAKQTPQAIAYMRELLPTMVKLLQAPAVHQSLRIQQQAVNWDAINAIEEECGLPLTPCPNTDVTLHLGLKEDPSAGK
jgi:hypothetical protein